MKTKPMTNRPIVLTGPEEVASEAAERTVKIAKGAIGQGRNFRLVLSGGSTPKRLYELLAGDPFRSRIHWNRVHFFWGDERCVGPDHPDSNYRMTREALLSKLGIHEANVHRLKGEASDPEAAARDYEEEIRKQFGVGPGSPPPSFDLVLLGMGADGHTASLFPGTQALKEVSRWVVENPVPKLGPHRLTLTPVILNRAACVIFLVTGADKAKTLAEVLEGPLEPGRLPAQLIHPMGGKLFWLVDRAAAACLKTSQET
jgi:6-phosphogluconolactonase